MGGAVGHLYHLYDNPDLSFGEIKSIIKAASAGKLEKVSEKLDGLNLVFTWDEAGTGLRVARNSGDIKSGGMDAAGLASKFADRGNLTDAFNSAYKVLNQALGALPPKVRAKVFGPDGRIWYSMELIYSANPNVIQYDGNNVVFHGWPVFKSMPDGSVEKGPGGGVDFLVKHLDNMQSAVKEKDWKVRGPALVAIKRMSDKSIPQRALTGINKAMAAARVGDGDTIQDYLFNYVQADAKAAKMPPGVIQDIAARVASIPGAPNLTQIKSKIDKNDIPRVQEYVKQGPKTIKSAIAPIEAAIHDFATEALRGLESTLISKSGGEVQRLRAEVQKAIAAIEASGNETAMSILQTQMKKLGSIENLATPMEGVVFVHDGNAYKFTGSFAPVNQILGLVRYGRGKTKLTGESLENLIKMICESVLLMEDEESDVGTALDDEEKKAFSSMQAAEKALKDAIARSEQLTQLATQHRPPAGSPPEGKAVRVWKKQYGTPAQIAQKSIPALQKIYDKARSVYSEYDPSATDWKRQSKTRSVTPAPPAEDKSQPSKAMPGWKWDAAKFSTGGWVKWPPGIKKFASADFGKQKKSEDGETERGEIMGVGPGERWLGALFGGRVAGGNTSYDIIMPDGSRAEVKEIESATSLVRPGIEGINAFEQARGRLNNIMNQLKAFATAFKTSGLQESASDHEKQIVEYIDEFLRSEYESIVGKGEISRDRFKDIRRVLKAVAVLKENHRTDVNVKPQVTLNDKTVSVKRPTFIDIARKVDKDVPGTGVLDNIEKWDVVLNNLKDVAFDNYTQFFNEWFNSVKVSQVFKQADGVFVVNEKMGFQWVPKDQLEKAFRFEVVSQARPKFKFLRF